AAPSLVNGEKAFFTRQTLREMNPLYRYIPRTIQKLWKGEPVHIIVMGSSIDRGSANPPLYVYDENPASKKFKQPLCDYSKFDTALVGRPELNDYFGESRHWFSYCGRLKVELMNKFDLSADKICLNFMACDGSCIGESHSGLNAYCSLSLPPEPRTNGHKSGKTWQEIYPGLFSRPEGPRPDLIIYGSGANEKTDTPDEVAVFEGAIRWIQRNYPDTEFIFCQYHQSANSSDMQALALRYQIPYIDHPKIYDALTEICDPNTLVPADGHPQAAAHYIWFKQLEKAFEVWDPIVSGIAQLQLPERLHRNTYGWEGDMTAYDANSKRIHKNRFIFDDTVINLWGSAADSKAKVSKVFIDGMEMEGRAGQYKEKNLRNSLFRHGALKLGDRHILEVPENVKISAIDAKICPNRTFYPVSNQLWKLGKLEIQPFNSSYGAPYGTAQVIIPAGESIQIETAATDISIAYADSENGGNMNVYADDKLRLAVPANIKYAFINNESQYLENRKGINGLPFGLHLVKIEATGKPVAVLGIFAYDSRPNSDFSRQFTGMAAAGQTVEFSVPFKARPAIFCSGNLQVKSSEITPSAVTFSGSG
ncbi:MAG: SGNH/GDSL hydrolase family protein, partial [Victivallaceae bacterium]